MVLIGHKKGIILKLVLLPGMDGTGALFHEFLSYLNTEYLILSLPIHGSQDHSSLAKAIQSQLPKEEYILLAESFSGGIVPELLKQNTTKIKGLIFVASFLSCPNIVLLSIAQFLPLKALATAPLSNLVKRQLLLGSGASKTLLATFTKVTRSIPNNILKNRIKVMRQQQLPIKKFYIPTVYIQAKSDRLISHQKSEEVSQVFKNIQYIKINGPHFILQAEPKESAITVTKIIKAWEL